MLRFVRQVTIVMMLCSFAGFGVSQGPPNRFVVDKSKPYVYIAFDHAGKRQPVQNWESSNGLWLRLVNNCYLPIRVRTFGLGTSDPGVGIAFDVVRAPLHVVSPGEPQSNPPPGYEIENADYVTILPQKDLLFSVPAETVSKAWHIQVRFSFDLPEPANNDSQPQSLVEFTWDDIPKQFRKLQSYSPESPESKKAIATPASGHLLHESGHVLDPPKPQ